MNALSSDLKNALVIFFVFYKFKSSTSNFLECFQRCFLTAKLLIKSLILKVRGQNVKL